MPERESQQEIESAVQGIETELKDLEKGELTKRLEEAKRKEEEAWQESERLVKQIDDYDVKKGYIEMSAHGSKWSGQNAKDQSEIQKEPERLKLEEPYWESRRKALIFRKTAEMIERELRSRSA